MFEVTGLEYTVSCSQTHKYPFFCYFIDTFNTICSLTLTFSPLNSIISTCSNSVCGQNCGQICAQNSRKLNVSQIKIYRVYILHRIKQRKRRIWPIKMLVIYIFRKTAFTIKFTDLLTSVSITYLKHREFLFNIFSTSE